MEKARAKSEYEVSTEKSVCPHDILSYPFGVRELYVESILCAVPQRRSSAISIFIPSGGFGPRTDPIIAVMLMFQ